MPHACFRRVRTDVPLKLRGCAAPYKSHMNTTITRVCCCETQTRNQSLLTDRRVRAQAPSGLGGVVAAFAQSHLTHAEECREKGICDVSACRSDLGRNVRGPPPDHSGPHAGPRSLIPRVNLRCCWIALSVVFRTTAVSVGFAMSLGTRVSYWQSLKLKVLTCRDAQPRAASRSHYAVQEEASSPPRCTEESAPRFQTRGRSASD